MSTLGGRIKEIRNKAGITQEDLAKVLQVKRATLSNWEIDRALPDAFTLKKIADHFDVSTDYLLGRTEMQAGVPVENVAVNHKDALADFPPEARKSIEDYIAFVRKQYGIGEKKLNNK